MKISLQVIAATIIVLASFTSCCRANARNQDTSNSKQGIHALMEYMSAVNADAPKELNVIKTLSNLEHNTINLDSLASIANQSGIHVEVRSINLQQIATLRCVALVELNKPDYFALVLAVGKHYSLIWKNSDGYSYVETHELKRCYTGHAMVLKSATTPIIRIADPVVMRISSGPMSYVSARFNYTNISNTVVHIAPQPCGCSHEPRGHVNKSDLKAGQTATFSVKSIMPQFSPYCLPLPLETNKPSCPVIFLALMILPPKRATSYPSSIQLESHQYSQCKDTIMVYMPPSCRIISTTMKRRTASLRVHYKTETIEAPVSCSVGKIVRTSVILNPNTRPGNLNDELMIYYTDARIHKVFRVPIHAKILPNVWLEPSELFIGDIKSGISINRTVTLRSFDNISCRIRKIQCSSRYVSLTSHLAKSKKSASLTIKFSNSTPTYIHCNVEITLTNGSVLSIPISAMVSDN